MLSFTEDKIIFVRNEYPLYPLGVQGCKKLIEVQLKVPTGEEINTEHTTIIP